MAEKLIPTHELCRRLGLSPRTVQRYVKADPPILVPDMETAGGHYRWDEQHVRDQLAEYARRKREERENQ